MFSVICVCQSSLKELSMGKCEGVMGGKNNNNKTIVVLAP